jgi:hypothetical protein
LYSRSQFKDIASNSEAITATQVLRTRELRASSEDRESFQRDPLSARTAVAWHHHQM